MSPPPFVCFAGIAPTVGDTAIGQSILDALRARVGLPVRVHSTSREVFRALPGIDQFADVRHRLPIVPAPPRSAAFPFHLQRLLRDLRRTGGARLLPPEAHDALREALNGCAAVVFQGGPDWNDRMTNRRKVLERWLFVEAARHYKARVYHVGVSCGPFAWAYPQRFWMAPLSRNALDRHDLLFVRDAFSRPSLDRLGVTSPVVESTDAAVFLAARQDPAFAWVEERIRAASGRPRVVVCVRDYQRAYPDALAARDDALRTLAGVLDHVQARLADVFFLSTDHRPRPEKQTDAAVARLVQRIMTAPGSVVIDADVRNPAALKHIYGQFDAMVSMRLHPTILALDHGVPCLLLSYDRKCDDFFSQVGLQEYVVPLADIDGRRAIQQIAGMLGRADLRRRITAAYGRLKAAHAADYEPMYEQIACRARELMASRHTGAPEAVACQEQR